MELQFGTKEESLRKEVQGFLKEELATPGGSGAEEFEPNTDAAFEFVTLAN